MTEFSFKKEERLTSKILINKLFTQGKTINCYPLKLVYIFTNIESHYPAQVLISVPKKNFKKAVERNLMRRRIREAYRLNKTNLYRHLLAKKKSFALAFVYTAKEIKDYNGIEGSVHKALCELIRDIH